MLVLSCSQRAEEAPRQKGPQDGGALLKQGIMSKQAAMPGGCNLPALKLKVYMVDVKGSLATKT